MQQAGNKPRGNAHQEDRQALIVKSGQRFDSPFLLLVGGRTKLTPHLPGIKRKSTKAGAAVMAISPIGPGNRSGTSITNLRSDPLSIFRRVIETLPA
jgi:hypothetical protein